VLRAIADRLRLERLRQLWMQCDLFDALTPDDRATAGRPEPPHATRPPRGKSADGKATKRPSKRPSKRPIAGTAGSAPVASAAAGERRVRVPRTHKDDVEFVHQLQVAHAEYNAALFHGELKPVVIRISRRMKNRLGHYMEAGKGLPAEIAISRRHLGRDPWDDVLHTLVHEMVHQWQDENGYPLDHSQIFRRKAREVGISARATRPADFAQRPRLAARAVHRRSS
jgi:hypothetical protein